MRELFKLIPVHIMATILEDFYLTVRDDLRRCIGVPYRYNLVSAAPHYKCRETQLRESVGQHKSLFFYRADTAANVNTRS